eukprot:TRINITY_DN24446_c0_g3_i1.p1 TRINITY_DN24446_c0_g3~~TRINITY_DN24446_c0_g3_i1.p1  ORF type:complete len:586 (+),score=87.91 TRINITY_DN24446_c0_g3_i1:82-1839(+)
MSVMSVCESIAPWAPPAALKVYASAAAWRESRSRRLAINSGRAVGGRSLGVRPGIARTDRTLTGSILPEVHAADSSTSRSAPPRAGSSCGSAALPAAVAASAPLVPKRPVTPLKITSDLEELACAQTASAGPSIMLGDSQMLEGAVSACTEQNSVDFSGNCWNGVMNLRDLKTRIPHELLEVYGPSKPKHPSEPSARQPPKTRVMCEDLKKLAVALESPPRKRRLAVQRKAIYSVADEPSTEAPGAPVGKSGADIRKKTRPSHIRHSGAPARLRRSNNEPKLSFFRKQPVKQPLTTWPTEMERSTPTQERATPVQGGSFQERESALPSLGLKTQVESCPDKMRTWMTAVTLQLPVDVVNSAAYVFEKHARPATQAEDDQEQNGVSDESFNILDEGVVPVRAFVNILCDIVGIDSPSALPGPLLMSCFHAQNAAGSADCYVGFKEFALWFSRICFCEEMLLTPQQMAVRAIARTHGMTCWEVDHIKAAFDYFDGDGSGAIDEEEFGAILAKLLKIPPHLQLPSSRVRQFWKETDVDGGGCVEFEEFLLFYKRYFTDNNKSGDHKDQNGDAMDPLVDFYRAIRRVPL